MKAPEVFRDFDMATSRKTSFRILETANGMLHKYC